MYTIPTQYYNSMLDWVIEYSNGHFSYQTLYKVIQQAETVSLPAPKGIDPVRFSTTWHYREAFTCIIPFGRVVTGSAYVVTPSNKRIHDLELNYDYPFQQLPDPIYIEETIATLIWGWNLPGRGSTQDVYGHWFLDILPRIHLLERSGIAIDKYLIGKLTKPYQWESLKLLDFPIEKLVQVDRDDYHLIARNLVVPAVPVYLGKSPRWAIQFLQQRLKLNRHVPKLEGYERIYITRQDAAARFVLNEEEVMQHLAPKGFRKITLTPLTTEDKIAIFSSAQVIVAPFGSGNTNLVFCSPGTKVIEMTPNTVMDDYFWKISCHVQLDYYELICEAKQPLHPIPHCDSFHVDIPKLAQVLDIAGINP